MYERSEIKTRFYNSAEWRRLSKSYASSKAYICERCNNKNLNPKIKPLEKQLHVHHRTELTDDNISDHDISLNWDNLQLLCLKCHNEITRQKEILAPGLVFDINGMIRKEGDIGGKRQKGNTSRS